MSGRLLAAAALSLLAAVALPGLLSPPAEATVTLQVGDVADGQRLYATGCASCHGAMGEGTSFGPPLVGAGAANADYQLRTGRMPATDSEGQSPRKPSPYRPDEIEHLVAFVATLGDGPPIPEFELDDELLPRGQQLFVGNCAPCHGATANGGAVGGGWIAPALGPSEPLTVAEAMVAGPGQMPVFDFRPEDLNAVVTYTQYLRAAPSPGGFEIGGIGPVPEGLVAWFVGMGGMLLIVVLVGRDWSERRGRNS